MLGASKAFAFSVEHMSVETEALAMSACQAPALGNSNAYHQQLIAELTTVLKGRPRAEIDAQVAAAICPICGCPIE